MLCLSFLPAWNNCRWKSHYLSHAGRRGSGERYGKSWEFLEQPGPPKKHQKKKTQGLLLTSTGQEKEIRSHGPSSCAQTSPRSEPMRLQWGRKRRGQRGFAGRQCAFCKNVQRRCCFFLWSGLGSGGPKIFQKIKKWKQWIAPQGLESATCPVATAEGTRLLPLLAEMSSSCACGSLTPPSPAGRRRWRSAPSGFQRDPPLHPQNIQGIRWGFKTGQQTTT